ncbi:MAG: NAD(P)/FAD-dependent oxidoreductase [Halalkalicoccus sp.]
MSETDTPESTDYEYDVVIVGGGPAGCSAGVFCAREGLDTAIFDRGNSSLRRCAHLENYLGFPGGIDIETFYDLAHAHAEAAGCEIVPDMVEVVRQREGGGFVIETQENRQVSAGRVVSAARYDAEYLKPLGEEAMFESYEYDGETHEHFDRSYPDSDGATPVEGLYVASPADEDDQAIMAAGRGARVARRVIADARMDEGWWEKAAEGVDWMRRESSLDDEWAERETWVEWFDEHHADAPVSPDGERFERVRETYVDEQLSTYLPPEEIDSRATDGQEALAAHVAPEAAVEAIGEERLLDAIDDVAIGEYAASLGSEAR